MELNTMYLEVEELNWTSCSARNFTGAWRGWTKAKDGNISN